MRASAPPSLRNNVSSLIQLMCHTGCRCLSEHLLPNKNIRQAIRKMGFVHLFISLLHHQHTRRQSSPAVGDTCVVVWSLDIVDGYSAVVHPHSQLARVDGREVQRCDPTITMEDTLWPLHRETHLESPSLPKEFVNSTICLSFTHTHQ